jgi:VWFA-related protein
MRFSSWAWICLLSFSIPSIAQQSTPATESTMQPGAMQPSSATAAGRQINLDVVVTDRSGKVIPGLTQQSFSILDNKRPSNILSFRAVNGDAATSDPAEIILLLDQVNTAYERVAFERDEVKKFLTRNGGKLDYPVSLVLFSDLGTQIQNKPTRDGNVLAASLDQSQNSLRTIGRSQGFYGAQDRLQLSLKTLSSLAAAEAPKPGRKIVIWISPGWPILSGPRIQLSANDAKGIFSTIVNVSTMLRQAGITLYSVDPLGLSDSGGLRTTYYQEFLKGVTGPGRVDIGNLALQVIATQSGGLVTYGSNSVVSGLDRSIADLSAYYVLSIEAAPADKVNEYHGLEVKVATPGLTARTRTGYYAQP